jgi:hypothetical protein
MDLTRRNSYSGHRLFEQQIIIRCHEGSEGQLDKLLMTQLNLHLTLPKLSRNFRLQHRALQDFPENRGCFDQPACPDGFMSGSQSGSLN